MNPFSSHRGLAVTLDSSNVDTDQIIPKQFLKSIKRTGFGPALFFDWRYGADGKDNPDFELNHPRYKGASVLVVRNNFGCGSSREHAVWAVMQYGFRAVIAPKRLVGGAVVPGFADIFRNNAGKNGLLCVELTEEEVEAIFQAVKANPGLEITVDLVAQTVVVHAPATQTYSFAIDSAVRNNLLQGLDDIALTLEHTGAITAFESRHTTHLRAAG
jgi:3-isopropylmalate/(R)-2-methylmalate dehydratase small subunit